MSYESYNENEYIEFGDTRNPRGNNLEYKYNKHNKGIKEKARIFYIKERREEQSLKSKTKSDVNTEQIINKKNNKRILKKIFINDKNYENNTQKIIKYQKKKKIPKKGRKRF